MATKEFTPKNNITPEGGYQRSIDLIEYTLTRGEAVDIIANLAKMLALPGGHSVTFTVDKYGQENCRVCFSLVEKDKDPSLRY